MYNRYNELRSMKNSYMPYTLSTNHSYSFIFFTFFFKTTYLANGKSSSYKKISSRWELNHLSIDIHCYILSTIFFFKISAQKNHIWFIKIIYDSLKSNNIWFLWIIYDFYKSYMIFLGRNFEKKNRRRKNSSKVYNNACL